ncbi:MAG: hypothetical protein A2V99_03855 [Spirochaetes bacterium RBG_16_67_19]|nr:MAG: hypothetical protein A2064_13845 [Spirochaetes bacterium GWB1_66_5]OHD73452.1 MAG: hypothetical protein A2V99_03855 [Spirochaetes bacterium RBG_16_67_19]
MPKGLIEGLLTFLGILFFFVLPMIARARSAARRGGQLGGLRPSAPGRPRAPEVAEEAEEEPEEEPVTAAAPIPATPQPPPAALAPGGVPGGPQRLRRLTPWQRAVVWAEILGPPRGLQ